MRVLIVPSWYPTVDNPIKGSFFKEQAEELVKQGIEVIVAYISTPSIKELNKFELRYYIDNNIHTYRFTLPVGTILRFGKVGHLLYIKIYFSMLNKIYKKILEEHGKPDIIHIQSYVGAGIGAMLLSQKYNIPYVITEHLSNFLNKEYRFDKILINDLKSVFKNADKCIAVSKPLAKSIQQFVNREIIILPNMVNTGRFLIAEKKEEKNKIFEFLFVGSLNKLKRVNILIESFELAFREIEEVRLRICGSGPEREKLERQVEKLGISEKVIFRGTIYREQMPDIYSKADCFVLPSYIETFGVVYIEALASGIPIIGTKNGGAEDIITKKNGILVDVDDTASLSDALLYMYYNSKKYNSEEIRKDAINSYDSSIVSKKLIEIYDQVSNR